MAYGREILRKAGSKLKEFDDAYSRKVKGAIIGDPKDYNMAKAVTVDLVSHPLTPKRLEIEEGDTAAMIAMGRAYQAVGPIVGGTVRYGLPAAGVTAAGMGLTQLASNMSQQTSGTLDTGSNYNYIENVPKERTLDGSPEGELLVAGMKGFGPYAEYDPVILGSRVNDLQEQMGYQPVRATGFYQGGVIPED